MVNGVSGVNRSEGGEQLTEDKEVDGVEGKVHVSRDFVALNGPADAAALPRLQFLAQFIQAAANGVKSRVICGSQRA